MKALSLLQPWASLVIVGAKGIETRSWRCPASMIGQEIAIHASKAMSSGDRDFCNSAMVREALDGRSGAIYKADPPEHWYYADKRTYRGGLPLGAILGTVRIVDCAATEWLTSEAAVINSAWAPHTSKETELAFGNYEPGRFGFLLTDVRQLAQPIPARGALGFWTVPPDLEVEIRKAAAR